LRSKKVGIYLTLFIVVIALYIALKIQEYYIQELFNIPLFWKIVLELTIITTIFFTLVRTVIGHILQLDHSLKDMIDHTLHELNTPVATIEANITLLKRDIDDKKTLVRFGRIQRAIDHLKQLYHSLEYDIKSSINYRDKSYFNLSLIIRESIDRFSDISSGVDIINVVDKDIYCFTDREGFSRVVDNMVSNGIKYNQVDGFLKIYMQDSELVFEDSGIGIDPKNLLYIYEKSFQEDKNSDGFGLGLHFVKSYCDEFNIGFNVDTKREIGSRFRFAVENILSDGSHKLPKS
jgi:signal transduction histidine kinase